VAAASVQPTEGYFGFIFEAIKTLLEKKMSQNLKALSRLGLNKSFFCLTRS
jgi:hypothetical protein